MKKLVLIFAALVALSSQTHAQLGSVDKDLVFTPVTPCRIFDTRTTYGGTGPILTNGTKTFAIWGQTSYASQGGKAASDCGITAGSNTAAVALSMAVVSPSAQGYLTAYPAGEVKPLAATMNYNTGEVVVSNAAILKVNQTNGNAALSIFASSSTEVIADVVGYYSKPVATALTCTTVSGVPTNINAGAYASLPTLFCPANSTPMGLSISAGENVLVADTYTAGNAGQIFVRSMSANAQNVTAKLQCCQIPGR